MPELTLLMETRPKGESATKDRDQWKSVLMKQTVTLKRTEVTTWPSTQSQSILDTFSSLCFSFSLQYIYFRRRCSVSDVTKRRYISSILISPSSSALHFFSDPILDPSWASSCNFPSSSSPLRESFILPDFLKWEEKGHPIAVRTGQWVIPLQRWLKLETLIPRISVSGELQIPYHLH